MVDAPTSSLPAAPLAPRRVPEGYVRAEIAAFPLTSEQAFADGLTRLDPGLEGRDILDVAPDERQATTRRLWRACEEAVVPHAGGWSLDRLVAVRDQTWFPVEPSHSTAKRPASEHEPRGAGAVSMHRYLRQLAHSHVESQTGSAELHRTANANEFNAVAHYHWLSFSMPDDLVLAAVDIDPPPVRIGIENILLMRALIDRSVAEIHHHVGAGMDFRLLWAGALAALASPELPSGAMVGPGAPFGDGRRMQRWLLAAALTRIVLVEFLIARESRRAVETLHEYVDRLAETSRERGVRRSADWMTFLATLKALVLAPQGAPPDFEPLSALYGEWHPRGRTMAYEPPGSVEEAWRGCDPVAIRLGLGTPSAGERWLVRHALSYLELCDRTGSSDPWFEKAFWQVTRLRCLFYRHIVQRPLTAGLQWFIRYFWHIDQLGAPLRNLLPEAAFRVAGEVAGTQEAIAALEARVRVKGSAVDFGERLRTLLLSWRRVLSSFGGEPEFGVVAHFIKDRDPHQLWKGGRPAAFGQGTYAQPGRSRARCGDRGRDGNDPGQKLAASAHEVRFGSYLEEQTSSALALADLLYQVPRALWLVRGIDVAADELGVPTWVLVPLYRYVRERAAYASVLPGAAGAPTLRTTAHVGEDFRHLLEGLRRVFEATQYLLALNGSRLGHATALGLDPRTWAESVGCLVMPKEDRLWDLVFEWRLYAGYHVPPEFLINGPAGRQARLAVQIRELACDIYGDDERCGGALDPHALAQLHHDLHGFIARDPRRPLLPGDISVARGLNRVRGDPSWSPFRRECLDRYLCDASAFEHGQQLIEVSLNSSDIVALTAVQEAVRRGVAERGIVVEINPTSNLLVGDMLDLRNHPILRLFPIEPDTGPPPVPIAIGSDDPVTFNTSLLREYGLLYYTARGAGHSDRTVRDWLDRVRKTSMDARFTLPWRPSAREQTERLLEILYRYVQIPCRERYRSAW